MTTQPPPKTEYDVVVVGSGAGALSTAVTAAKLGLDVVVVENSRRQTESAVADLTSKGMLINDVAPAERERMRPAVQLAMQKLLAGYDPETVGLFDAELDRIRK